MAIPLMPSSLSPVAAAITTGELSKFKIESLTVSTTNRTAIEVNTRTGDDRGGMALSGSKVMLRGDSNLGVFDKSDLSNGFSTAAGTYHDALVSDLKTSTAYVFQHSGTNFVSLAQLDQSTGAVPASPTVITLSTPVPYSRGEIYSGYGRVVYRNGSTNRVYDIDLPSGTVYDRGTVAVTRMDTESVFSYFSWGVAEFFDGELWLASAGPSYPVNTIKRYKVSDGTTQTIATTAGHFSDLASFIVDPVSQRWYFHYEGNSTAFNYGVDETLGFASAVISTTPSITYTPSSSITNANSLSMGVTFGEAVTGVELADFSLGGTASGWTIDSLVANSSTSYTLSLSQSGSADGTLTVSLAANSVNWTAGATTIPDSPAVSSTVTVDHTPPTASYSSQPSTPAAAMSLTFGVSFSESVSGMAAGDFSNIGTALGCVFTPSAASGSSVNVVVTQCQEGTLQLRLAANGVTDAAGNTGPVAALDSSVITLAASALSVTAGDKSINYGGSWTDSYTQSGLLGSDTVTVTYSYSGTSTLGTSYGPSATKPSAGGTYSIIPSVSYGGSNANRYTLTRNNGALTIARVAQSVLTLTSTTATYGSTLSLTTSGGSGTGSVSYAVSSGTCTISGSTLTPGDAGSLCVVTATKAADDNYTQVSSTATTVTVNRTSQASLTVTSTSATYGSTLALTATGGSGGGSVSWSVVSGTCTVSGSTLTPGNAGSSCVVRATKGLDTNYNAVNSADTAITINRASQAALSVSSTSATYGQTLSMTSTGGSGTGSVSWTVVSGTCSVTGSTLTPGDAGSSCVVRATKAQDTNYLVESSADTAVAIARTSQSSLVVTSTTATYGSTLSLTTSGGSGTGAVTWQIMLGTCTVTGSTLTPGDAGSSCVVRATKAQDTNYLVENSSNTTVTINRASQASLTVTSTSATYGQNYTLTTSGGSGAGAVTWTVVSGTCTVSGSTLTPGNAASSCVVRATKALDTNYNAVNSSNTSVTVNKAPQTGFSVTNAASFVTGSTLSLTAAGGQTSGSLSWSVTAGTCSLTGTSLTAARGGISCTVEVTRAGDSNYLSATDSLVITVNKIAQLLTFRSSVPSPANPGGTYTVSVDSDAFLAPTIAIANSSTTVCSVAAGVVTFNTVGSCVISASQAGNDVYSSTAASQTVNVVAVAAAAPAVTTPAVSVPVAPATSVATPVAVTTTTLPIVKSAVVTTTTTPPVVTTTTVAPTTTTTVPADPGQPNEGEDGAVTELKAGQTYAVVRGQKVKASVDHVKDTIVITLPNDVEVTIGSAGLDPDSAKVSADGVLRVFGDQTVEVRAQGLVPSTTYTVFMFSDPVELGRGNSSASGTVAAVVRIPKDAKADQHTIQVNGVGTGGEVVSVSLGFKVLERQNNTRIAVLAISLGMLLALLGGRPIFRRRRGIR